MSDSDSSSDFPTRSIGSNHDAIDAASSRPDKSSASLDATTGADTSAAPSVRIGRYKLLQQIGEGGMGSVWMAQQESPVRRRVAIKLVRAGMDSKLVIARFEAERQALAMMEHANIAKVFDAGTSDDGRPYFVMELVQGPPITKYCDKNQLSMRERLELFIPVCQAVHHAHQKGIIHRDLKPSNVMVGTQDGKAVPKVIDFGLAKAQQHQMQLTDRTLFTEFGQVVGTVQYMSPEQAVLDVHDVDTRSDIYALGVLLYELLTGSTPLLRSAVSEVPILKVLSMIRDSEPPRPSDRVSSVGESISKISSARKTDSVRLKQALSGDLDWIVMKAIDKDRERRFGSAAEFGEDIRRYLDDEPIEARPPSAIYRMGKFTRKHRILMAVTSTILLLLLAGIAGTTWFAIAAQRSKNTAEQALVAAEQSRATAVAEKERGDREKIMAGREAKRALAAEESAKRAATMADQEAKRAVAAEASAKRAATMADQEAKRALAAEEDAKLAAVKADQEAKRALAAEESAKLSAGIAEQEAKRAGKAKKAANRAATMAEQETARAKAAETRADEQARLATEASELAEARLARSDYWVAQTKFRDNSISGGFQLLDNIPERFRNFEWHYDYNHFRQSRLSFRARNGTVERLRLRPDGKYFSAIGRNSLYLFETETGARVDIGKIDQKKVYDADKSSDSLPLAIYDADWSLDGKLFGVLRRHQIDFNDGTTLDFIKSIPHYVHTYDSFVFSPDAELVYTYYEHALYPFSLATGEKPWTVKETRGHILSIDLSKDGSQLAVGRNGDRGLVQVYDSTNGKIINEFKTRFAVTWLAFSPDGSMLAIPKGYYHAQGRSYGSDFGRADWIH